MVFDPEHLREKYPGFDLPETANEIGATVNDEAPNNGIFCCPPGRCWGRLAGQATTAEVGLGRGR